MGGISSIQQIRIMYYDVANNDRTVILEKYEEVKCATQPQQTKQ